MAKITVSRCPIEGLYIIEPTVFRDERGYFMETYNKREMEEEGLNMDFVQDNQSMSRRESWCARFGVLSLTWPSICAGTQRPMDSGTVLNCPRKTKNSFISPRASHTAISSSPRRRNSVTR